jgi:PAS domain S-box-containing protein
VKHPSAAEEERQRLSALLMQAPAAIAVYRGPQLVVEFINPLCRRILGPRPQVGRSLLEAMPEFAQTEAYQVVRRVATTGESITGNELRVPLDREGDGVLRDCYFNFTTQPLRDGQGNPDGVVAFAVEVTDQVLARQEMEKLANQVAAERGMLEQVIQQLPAAVFLAEAPSGRLTTPSLEQILTEVTERARKLVGAHQSVTSMTVNNNWAQAITAVSLSDKYAQWRSYDTPPDGTGIYALAAQLGRPMRMTQQQLEAHPRFKHFGGEGSRHPPMRGWLAVPAHAGPG